MIYPALHFFFIFTSSPACCQVREEAGASRLALGEMDGSREVAVVAAELAALSGGGITE